MEVWNFWILKLKRFEVFKSFKILNFYILNYFLNFLKFWTFYIFENTYNFKLMKFENFEIWSFLQLELFQNCLKFDFIKTFWSVKMWCKPTIKLCGLKCEVHCINFNLDLRAPRLRIKWLDASATNEIKSKSMQYIFLSKKVNIVSTNTSKSWTIKKYII